MLWADRIAAETGITYDQPPLRIALYHSNLRIAALTHEYNCRYHSFGYLNGEVKILHGRIPGKLFVESNLQRIVARLNRKTIPRVFVGGQVYALEFSRILLGTRYTYSSRIGTLFRPRLAFASRITQLCVRVLREKGILRIVRILLSKLQRKRAAP